MTEAARVHHCLPAPLRIYVTAIDAMNRLIGRIAMYLIFVLIGILLWSSISKVFFLPSLWTLEMAQFTMVAFYILGGPYAVQLASHVRMDLFYGSWSAKTQATVDVFTALFLLYYLGVMLYGGLGSTAYSLGYFGMEPLSFFGELISATVTGGPDGAVETLGFLERSATAWRPYLWPIKVLMCFGISLMILQVVAEVFRDIGRIKTEASNAA